jgi:hypothetical protein
MGTVLDFDEKKFWIALFSIMARREAARESMTREHLAGQSQSELKDKDSYERTNWRVVAERSGRRLHPDSRLFPIGQGNKAKFTAPRLISLPTPLHPNNC